MGGLKRPSETSLLSLGTGNQLADLSHKSGDDFSPLKKPFNGLAKGVLDATLQLALHGIQQLGLRNGSLLITLFQYSDDSRVSRGSKPAEGFERRAEA
jgi:hypothetical protein